MVEIVQLNVYPVKSCGGISLKEVTLGETGINLDRNWMFVDAAGGFLTQRDLPALSRVQPELSHGALKLRAPGMPELVIAAESRGARVQVEVWSDECPAFDEGDEPSAWISAYLGFAARLVRFDSAFMRASNRAWTGGLTALNRFSDGFPLLVISEASVRDIGARLGRALPANRFRPNIVISGVEPYEEDYLDCLSGPGVVLKLVKPCSRCRIVNIDQDTAEVGDEPLLTLATYRSSTRLDGGVAFGQNAVIVKGIGNNLRVGDSLTESWRF